MHTPTPWEVGFPGIYAENPDRDGYASWIAEIVDCGTGEDEANAEYIVLCVNSHDGLVKALEAIDITLSGRRSGKAMRALTIARAALAKATRIQGRS